MAGIGATSATTYATISSQTLLNQTQLQQARQAADQARQQADALRSEADQAEREAQKWQQKAQYLASQLQQNPSTYRIPDNPPRALGTLLNTLA